MKKMIRILTLGCIPFLFGCTIAQSVTEYRKGTECFQCGEYDSAVAHLEKCVQLCPELARHQTNLSCAYFAVGEIDKAWMHARISIMSIGADDTDYNNCVRIYKYYEQNYNLNREDATLDEVMAVLGFPDQAQNNKLIYGCVVLTFEDKKLVSSSQLKLKK